MSLFFPSSGRSREIKSDLYSVLFFLVAHLRKDGRDSLYAASSAGWIPRDGTDLLAEKGSLILRGRWSTELQSRDSRERTTGAPQDRREPASGEAKVNVPLTVARLKSCH